MSNILVNATAARSSGALSILCQFIDGIHLKDNNQYYIFVDTNFVPVRITRNIEYVPINTRKWITRIWWEEFGVNHWIKQKKRKIDLYISFQNMGSKINLDIPQLIYYHQPLPLSDQCWSFFHREERKFFFYKKFYSFFVRRYVNENTNVVVQSTSIKNAFLKKFNLPSDKVHVITPSISIVDYTKVEEMQFNDEYIHCIYPATPLIYKNHNDIIEVLKDIREKDIFLFERIQVHFTFNMKEANKLYTKIIRYGLEKNILFDGVIPFDKLLSYYKSATLLLFPSYIETLGLPLLEAATAGMPIIVTDLPYARDVVGGYEGAIFVKLHDIGSWSNVIIRELNTPMRYTPYIASDKGGWELFFELINQLKK